MTDSPINPASAPPRPLPPMEEVERPPTSWPKVIGVISLIYAIGGLLCNVGINASSMLGNMWGAMFDIDIAVPPIVRATALFMLLAMLVLGIMMLTGAIGLLRRRRYAVGRLKLWALLRMAMILIGVVVTIATLPANLEYSKAMEEAFIEKFSDGNQSVQPVQMDQAARHRWTMVSISVLSGVLAVYPIFIMFFLSRRSIAQEVERWP